MNIQDIFETKAAIKGFVWSKRGDGIEKRVEKTNDVTLNARKKIAVKDGNGKSERQ